MTKQDPAKVKARKDRRRARAEEARMSSRREGARQSFQQYNMSSSHQQEPHGTSSLHQQVPPLRLGRDQNNAFSGEELLEPLSLGRQESGSAHLAALSRYNFLDFATGLQDQNKESKS